LGWGFSRGERPYEDIKRFVLVEVPFRADCSYAGNAFSVFSNSMDAFGVLPHDHFRLHLLYCVDGIQIKTPRVLSVLKNFSADSVSFSSFEQLHPNYSAKPVLTLLREAFDESRKPQSWLWELDRTQSFLYSEVHSAIAKSADAQLASSTFKSCSQFVRGGQVLGH
jgi:hypothetical protein